MHWNIAFRRVLGFAGAIGLFVWILPDRVSGIGLEGLAGAERDGRSQGYRYVGIGLSHPLDDQWQVRVRLIGAELRYRFDSGGETLAANVRSLTPSIGLSFREGALTLGLMIGEDFRSTTRGRPGASHETEKDHGLFVQGELDYGFARIHSLSGLASYTAGDDFVWSRARLKRQITNTDFSQPVSWFAGPEVVGGRNIDFRSLQFGAFVERVYRPLNLSVAIKGGYKNTSADPSTGYTGIEFYVQY